MEFCRHCGAGVEDDVWTCAACGKTLPYELFDSDEQAVCGRCEVLCDSGDQNCTECGATLPARAAPEIDWANLTPWQLRQPSYQALAAARTPAQPPVRLGWVDALKKNPTPLGIALFFGLFLMVSGATVEDSQRWNYACPTQAHILIGYDFVHVQTADGEDGTGVPDPGAAYFRCKRHAYKVLAGSSLLVLAGAGVAIRYARGEQATDEPE